VCGLPEAWSLEQESMEALVVEWCDEKNHGKFLTTMKLCRSIDMTQLRGFVRDGLSDEAASVTRED
jgi:hypothetical protein